MDASDLPEPDTWVTHTTIDKPCQYGWHSNFFDIDARADSIDVSYDFEGRMGSIDLFVASDPSHVEELAYALLAAVSKARELSQ